MTFHLDRKGGADVLKQFAAAQINTLARQVASKAGPDAEVAEYTTDRAAASVRVPAEQQAKDGVLTRAAASIGLEVRTK